MRTILFRARCINNGQWVYGYYSCDSGKYHFIKSIDDYLDYRIDPYTLGQYTGLIDKDGNKIFEGDIIQFYKTSAYVIFRRGEFCAIDNNNTGYFIIQSDVRIIGNIHDNEELLDK